MAWIGVDLDGTLAHYDKGQDSDHIGAPIPAMVSRVKGWIAEGKSVRIFTARFEGHEYIEAWCLEHVGRVLPITNQKSFDMIELWDDRAIQIVPNTGARADGR